MEHWQRHRRGGVFPDAPQCSGSDPANDQFCRDLMLSAKFVGNRVTLWSFANQLVLPGPILLSGASCRLTASPPVRTEQGNPRASTMLASGNTPPRVLGASGERSVKLFSFIGFFERTLDPPCRAVTELGFSLAEAARRLGVTTSSVLRAIERAERGTKGK